MKNLREIEQLGIMQYRAEIDGLRAIAVIAVIFFHAGFKTFQGGFVGVDIFFVISGYLIATTTLTDIQRNSFSLLAFYERRARRILPALFLSHVSLLQSRLVLATADRYARVCS
ncbi:MAG: acyltransferase [Leptolyngbya sp. SIOISBB]|nr:acyltransferase [Leptolyngbya sp. SIOISBB]